MTVYSDMAHGETILDGSTAGAIEKLARKRTTFETQVNLCVALAHERMLDKAVPVCDAAIALSKKQADRLRRSNEFGRWSKQIGNTGAAIALTNRGVLYAIEGNREQARALFEQAIGLGSREESAALNLNRLNAKADAGRAPQ